MLRDAVEVSVGSGSEPATIEQLFFEAEPDRKAPLLAALLMHHQPESCVVFCNTRRDVAELVGSLAHYGFSALALHGDMEQRDRDRSEEHTSDLQSLMRNSYAAFRLNKITHTNTTQSNSSTVT